MNPAGHQAAKSAQALGAISIAFGVLVLIGSAIPWLADSTFALTDDLSSAWPLIVVGLVGVLGGVDGLRGSVHGPAVAAGIGSVFVLLQVGMVRALVQASGLEMGGGGLAWTVAALAAVVLGIAVLSVVRADRAEGTAPSWLGGVVLIAGAAWVAGMVMPATPGVSTGDHVKYVLFGGDTFSDVMTALSIGIPAAFVLLAAFSGSRVAHGLAAGSTVFWAVAAVTAAAGDGSSGDSAFLYGYGKFWPLLLGALGVAIGSCLAMVLPAGTTPSPMFDATLPVAARPVTALAPVVGLALLPLAGIVGIAEYADDQDAYGLTAAGAPFDSSADSVDSVDEGLDPGVGDDGFYDDDLGENGEDDGVGGSVEVVCTDLVESTIQSAWQDVEGAIHVIILLDDNCEIGQLLDDPAAAFELTTDTGTVADATFDFSSQPVYVPAFGTSEKEIVFEPSAFVDLAAVETLGLGADAASGAGAGALELTYSYTCTNAPDGSGATASSAESADSAVVGEATGDPVPPETTPASDALGRLAEIADADAPFVESDVIDRWVPQISSKKPDVPLPNGTVWDAPSILDNHRDWRERFPRVRLLWSGDYSTYELTDYWVTIVAVPFDTPEGAVGWCDTNALPAEDCYAKLISHTHSGDGSTKLR